MMDELISRQAAIDALCSLNEYNARSVKAIKGLPSAQSEQKWIPCGERLPEYGEAVLTQLGNDDMEVNWIIDDEEGEWFSAGVVAWMPLPEPYKEEADDPEG